MIEILNYHPGINEDFLYFDEDDDQEIEVEDDH